MGPGARRRGGGAGSSSSTGGGGGRESRRRRLRSVVVVVVVLVARGGGRSSSCGRSRSSSGGGGVRLHHAPQRGQDGGGPRPLGRVRGPAAADVVLELRRAPGRVGWHVFFFFFSFEFFFFESEFFFFSSLFFSLFFRSLLPLCSLSSLPLVGVDDSVHHGPERQRPEGLPPAEDLGRQDRQAEDVGGPPDLSLRDLLRGVVGQRADGAAGCLQNFIGSNPAVGRSPKTRRTLALRRRLATGKP